MSITPHLARIVGFIRVNAGILSNLLIVAYTEHHRNLHSINAQPLGRPSSSDGNFGRRMPAILTTLSENGSQFKLRAYVWLEQHT